MQHSNKITHTRTKHNMITLYELVNNSQQRATYDNIQSNTWQHKETHDNNHHIYTHIHIYTYTTNISINIEKNFKSKKDSSKRRNSKAFRCFFCSSWKDTKGCIYIHRWSIHIFPIYLFSCLFNLFYISFFFAALYAFCTALCIKVPSPYLYFSNNA